MRKPFARTTDSSTRCIVAGGKSLGENQRCKDRSKGFVHPHVRLSANGIPHGESQEFMQSGPAVGDMELRSGWNRAEPKKGSFPHCGHREANGHRALGCTTLTATPNERETDQLGLKVSFISMEVSFNPGKIPFMDANQGAAIQLPPPIALFGQPRRPAGMLLTQPPRASASHRWRISVTRPYSVTFLRRVGRLIPRMVHAFP